jgi:hypothetical protein
MERRSTDRSPRLRNVRLDFNITGPRALTADFLRLLLGRLVAFAGLGVARTEGKGRGRVLILQQTGDGDSEVRF